MSVFPCSRETDYPRACLRSRRSGIGLAAAEAFAKVGMKLALCDVNFGELVSLKSCSWRSTPSLTGCSLGQKRVSAELDVKDPANNLIIQRVDVSKYEEVEAFREKVLDAFGEVSSFLAHPLSVCAPSEANLSLNCTD